MEENQNMSNQNMPNQNNTQNKNTAAQVDNTIHFKAKNINFSYIKEMIKKNKVLYLLMLFGIPAIGFLIAAGNDYYYYYSDSPYKVFDIFDDYIALVVFIAFVVPILIATTLHYWIFSRKKVDFIASMPINRRTIGISNMVLSFALMLLICVAFIIAVLCGALMTGKSIFLIQFVNVFVFMFLSMLFIYSVTFLSMARVGNIVAQAVIFLLVLFFIPLTNLALMSLVPDRYAYNYSGNNNLNYNNSNYEDEYMYSEPSSSFHYSNDSDYDSFSLYRASNYLPMPISLMFGEDYNNRSVLNIKVLQTVIYTIIIYGCAQILFECRKMENNQEGFNSLIVHEIVKGITMIIPIVSIITYLFTREEFEFEWYLLIYFVLFLMYFFIFDLLMFKKVKFSYSMLTLGILVSVSIIISIPLAIADDYSDTIKSYSLNDIESVSIGLPFTGHLYEIKDKKVIDKFMNAKERETNIYYNSDSLSNYQIKLKNGKVFNYSYYNKISYDEIDLIMADIKDDVIQYLINDLEKYSLYWSGASKDEYYNYSSLYSYKDENKLGFQEIRNRIKDQSLSDLYKSQQESASSSRNDSYKYGYEDDNDFSGDSNNTNSSNNSSNKNNNSNNNNYNNNNNNQKNYKYKKYVGYYYNGEDIERIIIFNY